MIVSYVHTMADINEHLDDIKRAKHIDFNLDKRNFFKIQRYVHGCSHDDGYYCLPGRQFAECVPYFSDELTGINFCWTTPQDMELFLHYHSNKRLKCLSLSYPKTSTWSWSDEYKPVLLQMFKTFAPTLKYVSMMFVDCYTSPYIIDCFKMCSGLKHLHLRFKARDYDNQVTLLHDAGFTDDVLDI